MQDWGYSIIDEEWESGKLAGFPVHSYLKPLTECGT